MRNASKPVRRYPRDGTIWPGFQNLPMLWGSRVPHLSRKPRTGVLPITEALADSISLSSMLNSPPPLFFFFSQIVTRTTDTEMTADGDVTLGW